MSSSVPKLGLFGLTSACLSLISRVHAISNCANFSIFKSLTHAHDHPGLGLFAIIHSSLRAMQEALGLLRAGLINTYQLS
jgi:hypothetical protein